MVFGFTTAVIAGFLLTAVPNWTGAPALQGGPLAFLVALWFAGRVAVLAPGGLPTPLVIAADVAFLPALALVLAPALLRKRNGRNLSIPPLLVLAAGANALVHLGALGVVAGGVQIGLQTGVDIVVVLLVVIGGRVVPLFTGNALRAPMRAPDWTDRWALYTVLAVAIFDLVPPVEALAGVAALIASLVNSLRMRGWRGSKTLHSPILWVLHLGYLWVVLGLALKGLSVLTGIIPGPLALHALTAGAIGTFTLGMMSRVALGHTGRPLQVKPVIAFAYGLVSAGALLRVAAPLLGTDNYVHLGVHGAGLLWAMGFLIFAVLYGPILMRPRIDGRPG